jgi:hypothetical protein
VPPASPPVMNVQVTTDREGHIAERHLLGCTLYSYEAAPTPYEASAYGD